MAGESFGLGVDVLAARPRRECADCGGSLVWDAEALDLFASAPLSREDRDGFAMLLGYGGTVYACTSCGTLGGFSPLFHL